MRVGQARVLLACAVTSKEHAKPEIHTHIGGRNICHFTNARSMGRRRGVGERAGIQSAGVSSTGESARGEEDRGQPRGAVAVCERGADGAGQLSGGN